MAKKNDNLISIPTLVETLAFVSMGKEIEELKANKKKICEMAVKTILHALDQKDHYTYGHSARVAYYSIRLGQEMGLNEEEMYDLELAAIFHDVGKIGIPDAVLNKPSRLDEDEFLIMKSHPEKTYEILADFDEFREIARYGKHHHERYDGRGYPDGMKGEEIPLFSRIILIADTFDAMTSTRPYRKGLPYQVAFDELREFAGTQFDPNLVEHFIKAMSADEKEGTKTFTLSILNATFDKEAA